MVRAVYQVHPKLTEDEPYRHCNGHDATTVPQLYWGIGGSMTMLTAPMPDRVLTDYPAEGDRWQWNRVQRTLENEQLYRGDFTPLLNGRVKTARNGLLQILTFRLHFLQLVPAYH